MKGMEMRLSCDVAKLHQLLHPSKSNREKRPCNNEGRGRRDVRPRKDLLSSDNIGAKVVSKSS